MSKFRVGLSVSLLVASLFFSTGAQALSIRSELVPLAYSDDGATVLVHVIAHGPEGGGEEGFELWGPMPPNRLRFIVSSDFSPGGGSHPQTVAPGQCVHRLTELDQTLAARGFHDITINQLACVKRAGNYLKTQKEAADEVVTSKWTGKVPSRDGYALRATATQLTIMKDATTVCTVENKLRRDFNLHVAGMKPARLVYIIAESAGAGQQLVGLCASTSGGRLQALPIR